MSHRSENGGQHLDEMRMAALFGTGKQYMQDYMEADDSLTGTFTCTECDTVFVQRDAYAMHMMMRAMNESCKSSALSFDEEPRGGNEIEVSRQQKSSETKENGVSSHVDGGHQRCLEDITAKVDQDEYLKCVLDKVCVNDTQPTDMPDYHVDDRKSCIFCKETFIDQDSLAMHVMSDHAEEMTSTSTTIRNNARNPNNADYMTWIAMATRPTSIPYICKYCNETFMSRDSLALHVLTHAHLEERISEQARNTYKRKYDIVDPASAFTETKKARHFSQVFSMDSLTPTKPSTSKSVINLYCEDCDIRFYAESEYDWHMRRHSEGRMTSYAEPLCLTKDKPSENDDVTKTVENNKIQATTTNKPRRNSFSCDTSVDIHHSDTLPKRPVSVGDCSSETLKQLNKTGVDKKGDDIGDKAVTKNELLQTINALSSSEQRIIYSVFGKDLSLKVSKPEVAQDMRTTVSPKHGKKLDKVDNYVPQLNDKHDRLKDLDMKNALSLTSDLYKNGDRDDRQRLQALEKEAPMCKYCEILFFNKALYYLHMGLHNVNNPWQCNICGKLCSNAIDFSAHVIHM
ncbi:hypothetical protein ACF0H5_016075 [Mactra antiquata]